LKELCLQTAASTHKTFSNVRANLNLAVMNQENLSGDATNRGLRTTAAVSMTG
jgi:hypothetical protein